MWGSAFADSPAVKATRAEVLPLMPFTIRAGSLCKLRRSAIDSKTCCNSWRLKRYQKGRQGAGLGPLPPQALGGRESRAIPLRIVGPQPGIWEPSEKPSLPPRSLICDSGHSAREGREVVWSGHSLWAQLWAPRVNPVPCPPYGGIPALIWRLSQVHPTLLLCDLAPGFTPQHVSNQTSCPGLCSWTSIISTSNIPLQKSPQYRHPPCIPSSLF